MPPPTHIHYGGYHSDHARRVDLGKYMGRKGERACIYLTKPRHHRSSKIEKAENTTTADMEKHFRKSPVTDSSFRDFPNRIAGTLNEDAIFVYPRGHKYMQDRHSNGYGGIGFTDRLKVTSLMKNIKCNAIDMAEIIESVKDCSDDYYEAPSRKKMKSQSTFEVQCVVQEKKCKGNTLRFQQDQTTRKLTSLNDTPVDDTLWDLVRTRLPVELYENIYKHMDYDQVCWLAEEKKKFARLLAFNPFTTNGRYTGRQ